jgi:hypothetical protein
MDFIVALPLSNGYDAISVVIDRFSKQAHFIPAKGTDDAPETSERFVENVVRHHGVPSEIVSDRDPKFTSRFWKELFKLLGTKLSLSTAAHPETDGQTERTNLTLEVMIRHFVNPQLNNWVKFLPMLEFAYNSTVNALGKTPFEIVYGYNPPDLLAQLSNTEISVLSVEDLRSVWKNVKDLITEAQTAQSKYANVHRSDSVEFKEGDLVLLSTKNFNTNFRAKNAHKFQSPYVGPFRIIQKISNVAFRLELPKAYAIHDVFYSGLLKKYVGNPPEKIPDTQVILKDNTPGYIIEALLRRRKHRNSFQYLVKWLDYPEHEASWEPRSNLMKDVPDWVEEFDRQFHKN